MANPNISLLGATYSDVSGVTLPTQGGGTATFPWVEGSQTVTQNNTYDVTNLAQMVVNVSGGGGASNVVTGTFKGTTTGAAMDITIPYTGSGYPINILIYPSEGPNNSSGTFYNTLQRYAIALFGATKCDPASIPTYRSSGANNQMTVQVFYKSSSTNASSLTRAGSTSDYVLSGAEATSSSAIPVARFKDAKTLSVFIASTSNGFMANIEYTYWVIYSS